MTKREYDEQIAELDLLIAAAEGAKTDAEARAILGGAIWEARHERHLSEQDLTGRILGR
jgi:hypothetical protein